jgi:HD-GYP domain-containing protein (c-di-GMP phosphodiesterase class II)
MMYSCNFLSIDIALTEAFIEKLKGMGINKVYIEDGRFSDIQYSEALNLNIRNQTVDEYVIKDIAKSIVDDVRENKDKGGSMLSTTAVDDYIVEHTVNVAILTAFLGNRMSFNYNQ